MGSKKKTQDINNMERSKSLDERKPYSKPQLINLDNRKASDQASQNCVIGEDAVALCAAGVVVI